MSLRELTRDDLDWALDVLQERRARIVPFAPRFWRPAPDARARHAEFLGALIEDPEVSAWRTDHGLVLGLPRPEGHVVLDDIALTDDALWGTEGEELIRAAADGRAVRFVCPVPEPWRAHTASRLGLRLAESWWHRDLVPADAPDPAPVAMAETADGRPPILELDGARLLVVDAPPVYAPGGRTPLLLEHTDVASIRRAEERAAELGAVLVVAVVHAPGGEVEQLIEAGYARHCDFYQGTVR